MKESAVGGNADIEKFVITERNSAMDSICNVLNLVLAVPPPPPKNLFFIFLNKNNGKAKLEKYRRQRKFNTAYKINVLL